MLCLCSRSFRTMQWGHFNTASLTSDLRKVVEKSAHGRLSKYIAVNSMLCPIQHGSCITYLLCHVDEAL